MALLGRLFTVLSAAQAMQLSTGAAAADAEDEAELAEEITDMWLRTVGVVSGARASGHPDVKLAVGRCSWLQHLGPALRQLQATSGFDPRLTEALETLLA